jgi:hypothetical protein
MCPICLCVSKKELKLDHVISYLLLMLFLFFSKKNHTTNNNN